MLLKYAQDSTPLPGAHSDGSYCRSFTARLGLENQSEPIFEPMTEIGSAWAVDDELAAETSRPGIVRLAYCYATPRAERIAFKTSFTDSAWVFSVLNSTDADGADPLDETLDGVNSLIAKRDFSFLDRILRLVPSDATNRYALLALARATFPVRSKLAYWQFFISNCHAVFKKRGLPADQLLKGLN
jgi:hypothetical protein